MSVFVLCQPINHGQHISIHKELDDLVKGITSLDATVHIIPNAETLEEEVLIDTVKNQLEAKKCTVVRNLLLEFTGG